MGMLHEVLLNRDLPEYMQALFDLDELQCMLPGNINSVFFECESCGSSAELIRL